jgi:hypothetical protein
VTALRILAVLSAPGAVGTPNEDIAGYGARTAWALDGATGLGNGRLLPGPSDAAWLAARYDALLRRQADATGLGLPDLFARLIAEVAAAFAAERLRTPAAQYELPSAGMAFVRAAEGRLDYARLGDCRAILALPGRRIVSTGSSLLNELDARVVAHMQAQRRSGAAATHTEARQAVQEELRANRGLHNRPGGYWVLGLDPEAARHMEVGVVPLEAGAELTGLLVSDGFYRLVDTLGAYPDDAALLAATEAEGLPVLLSRLRALEAADEDCATHPRLKVRDDATALLFRAVGG